MERIGSNGGDARQRDTYRIANAGSSVVDTHLLIVVKGLADRFRLENASGITSSGDPYIRAFLHDGVLKPGQGIVQTLVFRRRGGNDGPPLDYSLELLSGQGNP